MVDYLVCLLAPVDFAGVGQWYVDFPQTSDDEVRALLDRARLELSAEQVRRYATHQSAAAHARGGEM
jgi:predicted phosphoribosyltransferase